MILDTFFPVNITTLSYYDKAKVIYRDRVRYSHVYKGYITMCPLYITQALRCCSLYCKSGEAARPEYNPPQTVHTAYHVACILDRTINYKICHSKKFLLSLFNHYYVVYLA